MRRRRRLKPRPQRRRGSETVVSTVGPCRIQPSGLETPHLHQNRNIKAIIPQHHQRNCLLRPIHKNHLLRHLILAFECIPVLKAEFREPVPNYDPSCPRMCKWKFTSTGTTRYALEELYKALGNTKTISSILPPIEREQQVIYQTMYEGCWEDMELLDDGDDDDAIVDVWNKFKVQERGQIFWQDICKEDIKSRSLEIEQLEGDQLEEEEHEAGNEPPRIVGGEAMADLESLKETVMSLMSQMTTMEGNVNNKLEGFDRRLKMLEGDSIGREGFENMDFQYNEDGETSGQQEKVFLLCVDEEDEDDGKKAKNDDDNGEKDDTEKEHEDEEAEDDGNEHEDEDNDEKDDTEKDHDEEAEDDGNEHENDGKEPEKELEVQPEKEATDDAEDDGKEPQKELEVQPEKEATDDAEDDGKETQKELEVQPEKEATDDAEEYTFRVMEAAAEKVEAEAARKKAMTRPKRVLKPSHLQKSPFVKK
ncbi:unnamed protein product [Brassica oleracea var. botrytis]